MPSGRCRCRGARIAFVRHRGRQRPIWLARWPCNPHMRKETMRQLTPVIVLAIIVAGCTHTPAPVTAIDPARGVRNLTADSAEVLAIAMMAAREIQTPGQTSKAPFGGVYVNGVRARKASDEVIRANDF